MPLTFITGPVRSGKSRFAERLARETGRRVLYVATARRDPADAEWAERIARHRASRPSDWEVLESAEPGARELGAALAEASAERTILVDSFGTWLASRMDERTTAVGLEAEATLFAGQLFACAAEVVLVGEEVGWGIVPLAASARLFRDVVGRTQQRLARDAARAYLVVSGFAIDLRATGTSVDLDR